MKSKISKSTDYKTDKETKQLIWEFKISFWHLKKLAFICVQGTNDELKQKGSVSEEDLNRKMLI